MAVNNNKIYPKSGRIDLDGGLNNKFDKQLLPDNESPDCLNVIFNDGGVETRGGTDILNTGSVGSYICDGLYTRHENSGQQTMVAWFNGSLFTQAANTFTTVPSAQSIYTAGQQVFAAEYENYIFFNNGNNTGYKYGGSGDTFTRHGIPAPTTTMTAATAPTGTGLTGDYYYAMTFINSNLVEGDISPLTSTFTAASEDIRLTSLPVAPQSFGVNTRNIYRTANGGTELKRLVTIGDNTTTTYDDSIADGSLGVDAPTDNGEPPTSYSSVIYHQARLFFIDSVNNLIKYTELGNPYVVKSTNFLRVGDNTVDIPNTLAIYDNSLVVLCEENPWIIYMPTSSPSDWSIQRVRATYGCKSPFSPFKYNNKLMYGAVQNDKFVGFAAISGQTISPSASLLTSSAMISDLKSDRIEPDMFEVQESQIENITSKVYKNKAYITLTYGAGNTENNRFYVYDFSLGNLKKQEASWSPWTGLNANDLTILDGTLYYGSSIANGYVYEMNTDSYDDSGSAINSYYWTKEYPGMKGHENIYKDFRYMQLLHELSGDYYLNVNYRVDGDAGTGSFSAVDLNPGGSLWGTMRWGLDDWSAGAGDKETRIYLPVRGKRIQFRFSNQAVVSQKFKVVGLNFVYNNKGFR